MSCSTPPVVSNGVSSSTNTTAEYSCLSGFQMSGNAIISCTASGWGSAPTCTPIDLKNTIYAQFAPDWLMYLLAVLMSLLVLSCLACTIYYCCCRAAGAAIHPEGVGVGVAARSGSCCPCGGREESSSTYEKNLIHNSNSVRKKQDFVTNHTTTTIHGTEVNHVVEEPNGVYTTHDGLILVPVKPYELQEYQKTVTTKKTHPVHGTTYSDTNGSTPRSEKDGNDRHLKPVVKTMPLWMPHTKHVRNNNTSTH